MVVVPKVVHEVKATLPPLILDDEIKLRLGKMVEGSILENIMRQKQADGSPLQRNKPSTRKLKTKKGWLWRGRVMSLIAEKHRFVKGKGQSFRSRIEGKRHVVVEPAPGKIRDLSRWLQEEHPTRNRYTGWFGVSKEAATAMKASLREWIENQFLKAARRYTRAGVGMGTYRPEFMKKS